MQTKSTLLASTVVITFATVGMAIHGIVEEMSNNYDNYDEIGDDAIYMAGKIQIDPAEVPYLLNHIDKQIGKAKDVSVVDKLKEIRIAVIRNAKRSAEQPAYEFLFKQLGLDFDDVDTAIQDETTKRADIAAQALHNGNSAGVGDRVVHAPAAE